MLLNYNADIEVHDEMGTLHQFQLFECFVSDHYSSSRLPHIRICIQV